MSLTLRDIEKLVPDTRRRRVIEGTVRGPAVTMHLLAEFPEARQLPFLSHLEHTLADWKNQQFANVIGTIIVWERQLRIDLENIVRENVSLLAVRRLAAWHGFWRVHARRARLFIRP